mgnify:CR=1 FL=1
MRFARLSLNGDSAMIYIEMEHWTKEMFEKQGRTNVNVYQTGGGTSVFSQWDSVFEDINNDVLLSGKPIDTLVFLERLRKSIIVSAIVYLVLVRLRTFELKISKKIKKS